MFKQCCTCIRQLNLEPDVCNLTAIYGPCAVRMTGLKQNQCTICKQDLLAMNVHAQCQRKRLFKCWPEACLSKCSQVAAGTHWSQSWTAHTSQAREALPTLQAMAFSACNFGALPASNLRLLHVQKHDTLLKTDSKAACMSAHLSCCSLVEARMSSVCKCSPAAHVVFVSPAAAASAQLLIF